MVWQKKHFLLTLFPVDAGEGFADGEELFANSDFGTVKLGDESYKRNHVYSYLKIVMYMIGYGLPGWEWRIIEDDMPKLFSGWDGRTSLPHGGLMMWSVTSDPYSTTFLLKKQ